jgi:hypothetical protein
MAASVACSLVDGGGERVVFGLAGGKTPLMTRYCWDRPMAASSSWVRAASRSVGAAHGPPAPGECAGIGQRLHRSLVLAALFFQARQRPQARRIAFACFQKAAPCARQLQQADGVACGAVSKMMCA